jgi:hypothetical protein
LDARSAVPACGVVSGADVHVRRAAPVARGGPRPARPAPGDEPRCGPAVRTEALRLRPASRRRRPPHH